ncbi:SCO family protein [Aliigemmobacter aestuarii]|uniref:SCO family protein n=1 Tax=Aliigemmobacter aestuarii TaxID=1445661 RepID=A0A4S3MT52_9RHOB|nr:SCO family protein [Gemmobacter aestuarii]THD85677.1 SCO family protein [Gemmobacter aestuarii]
MMKLYAGVAAGAIVALVGGTYLYSQLAAPDDVFAQCRGGQVGGGAIGGPFTLIDENEKTVTDRDVITGPSLVYFGYTFCPDVCPLDNARNAEAVDILEERGIEVTPVFISVDPKRDTPEVLRDFTDNLHPRMIGLTGTPEQIQEASKAYKTYFKIQDPEEEFYLIDHSTFTYLVFPEIGFVEFFRREETPDEMAQRVACFVEAAATQGQN